ncbi:MAG: hypothetical protein GC201_10715 [Alphaproteobacteria bacterium]|nr:hypothetical protein [Alphaproteobacteria bacterium]
MDDGEAELIANAVAALRRASGGSDPWTETGGTARCRGGFAWHDRRGNAYDVTVRLSRRARPADGDDCRRADAGRIVMLGDDAVRSTDPPAWRFALDCLGPAEQGRETKEKGAQEGGSGRPVRLP